MVKRVMVGSTLAIALAAASIAALPGAAQDEKGAVDESAGIPPDVISPAVPTDIEGGAPNADLRRSAIFAWREFIALNWPALTQSGGKPLRDTPDKGKPFGDPKETGPLVWHTYRGKVEIFPGTGKNNTKGMPPTFFPTGYVNDPAQSYGYDAPPRYIYDPASVGTPTGAISPCVPSQEGEPTPWINLDETTQIGLDVMYAGVDVQNAGPNTDPHRIRFMAKANRSEYEYVVKNNYWWASDDFATAQGNLLAAIAYNKDGQYTYPKSPFLAFPEGTIEVKAAWRPLAKGEDPTHFYTTKVRYYNAAGSSGFCYVNETWALLALHIIQKTPTAPYFVFATFEQADNLLTPDGQPVEDDDGVVIRPSKNGPTTPGLTYHASPKMPSVTANGPYCKDQGDELYFQELGSELPNGGPICVNQRTYTIPRPIVVVNKVVHNHIRAYAKSHGFASTPWLHYKLVNVQAVPFDQSSIDTKNSNSPKNPATFYLANSVVETDYTLQNFTGRLTMGGASTNYPFPPNNVRQDFKNTFIIPTKGTVGQPIQAFNMGGCMGCHGQANSKTDISFILSGGPVQSPETASPLQQPRIVERYRRLFAAPQ
jgi:hypothetical protein